MTSRPAKKIKLLVVIIAALISLLSGCGTGISSDSDHTQGNEVKKLRMGVVPSQNPQELLDSYKPMAGFLEKEIKIPVELVVLDDYSQVARGMRDKQIDFAVFGPFSYVLASEIAGAEAFAVGIGPGSETTYKSIIVVRRDSGINRVEDLKGKSFAFVDPASTTGNLIPRAMFKRIGIDPEKDLKNPIFVGSHDAAELAVQSGKVLAAADHNDSYNLMVSKGIISPEEIKIIWESEPIPRSPLAYRKDLPEETKKKLRDTVLNIHRMNPSAIGGVIKTIRYDPADDTDYNVIREVAKTLNLDLSKMK
ncbi:MAG: phosphonate ABC transporter substrate-binding protein [Firmicutes bacterium]|nr:phosphonate ABC transporter substrate-binding protein [Bacillota bacterium]